MDIQFTERGATPFRVKLQGLRLDQKQVQSLLPEIQNKLEEYGKNYYRDLEHLTSSYFLKASQDWKLSKDEISFYFVLGMNLSSAFKTVKSEVDN
jgi:CRISPR-associated protein Csh1